MANRIRTAVIQMQCDDNGDKQHNIDLIEKLVGECCAKFDNANADNIPSVVLLPELATAGYTFDQATLWKMGEPTLGSSPGPNAVTENLLISLASRHQIYIGCSFLEATAGGDFLNTFSLAGPDGIIKGRVRKSLPAGAEAALFAGYEGSHVIEADGLRFGVLICFENYVSKAVSELQNLDTPLDVILSPFSGPLFEKKMDLYNDRPGFIASALYAPMLYTQKWGPFKFTCFPGQCTIADADGNVLVRMGPEGNGFEVREVQTGRSLRAERAASGAADGVATRPVVNLKNGSFCGGSWVLHLTKPLEWLNKKKYNASKERKEMALQRCK